MGAFTVACELQELTQAQPAVRVARVMVDTGSEYTWLPEKVLARAGVRVSKQNLAFVTADGTTITRDVGYAYLRSSGFETVDEVVFARPGDLRLLGARTPGGIRRPGRCAPETARRLGTAPRGGWMTGFLPCVGLPGTTRRTPLPVAAG